MKRMHLVELEDQPWFPAVLRDGGTAYLEFAVRLSGHAKALVPKIREVLAQTGQDRIVDLCSGGGGPVRAVVAELAAEGVEVKAHLTDFFPNKGAFALAEANGGGRITTEPESVNAMAVPERLTGLRTIFNAFHHFRPDEAKAILADAMRARRPIAVFEVISREPVSLFALLTSPLPVMLTVPFWRPFRPAWLFWTWVIPVMPLFVVWDGVVSWLRIHSAPELQEMVKDLHDPGWTWEIGTLRLPGPPSHATYLVGRPS